MRGMPYLGPLQTWCVGNIFSSDRLTNCLSWRWHTRQHAATPRLEDLTRGMSITSKRTGGLGTWRLHQSLRARGLALQGFECSVQRQICVVVSGKLDIVRAVFTESLLVELLRSRKPETFSSHPVAGQST